MNDPTRYQLIKDIYHRACELPEPERDRFLSTACHGDQDLRAEIEALLVEPTSSFTERLQAPILAGAPRPVIADPALSPDSSTVGPYRLLRLVGRGGMGVVYEAEQERPRRRVALKLIRPEVASERALSRFEHEAELLGRLQHPGIAQIYEAGLYEGQPFFAMEFVDGPALTAYVSTRNVGTSERLRLVARICEAVHHAHTKGVLHRDLKPANILVAEVGDPPVAQPKVLDFGIARTTDSDLTVTTRQTELGQVVGTLPYMSPEQLAGDADIDTRSDVYALGVVLYELLAERPPYDLDRRSLPEAARVIQEENPAPLSSFDTRFRGDIETIVGKALEKDRDRRYASALDLAADLRRHLAHEPITARPPSSWYQFHKFARRNRGLVGGVAAAFAVLAAGLISTKYGLAQAIEARETAEANEKRAEDEARRALEAEGAARRQARELDRVVTSHAH